VNTGKQTGGPIANPIREMIGSSKIDGVIFKCPTIRKAENTRCAAIMLKRRNDYQYKTTRKGNILTVYKPEIDPYEIHNPTHVYFDEEDM
jgi:hypothetical protein